MFLACAPAPSIGWDDMKTHHALIIGVCLVVGLLGFGISFNWKSEEHNEHLAEGGKTTENSGRHLVQAAMLEGDYPRSIEVGDEKLLYWPEIHYQADWVSTDYRFYRLAGGKLVRVEVENETP